jgi:hypothetical protein
MTSTIAPARRISTRIAAGLAAGGAVVAFSLVGAATASATTPSTTSLSPGAGVCSANQYASYQVRGDGTATGQGVKFKLLYNGSVLSSTPGRANAWAAEFRSAYGTFPGPGYYAVCAQNTGTTNSTVTLQIRTDGQF